MSGAITSSFQFAVFSLQLALCNDNILCDMKDAINSKPITGNQEITDDELEDAALLKLMMEVDRSDLVSREEIIEKLTK